MSKLTPAQKRKLSRPQCPRSLYDGWKLVKVETPDGIIEMPNYPAIATDYAERVVDGRVIAGQDAIRACRRFLKMRERAKSPRCDFYWSDTWVLDVCSFAEKLPHVESFSGLIVWEPCHLFWFAAIYGFRRRVDDLRLVRNVVIIVPRKNAKSLFIGAICLIGLVLEGEPGPEIAIGASTLEQANEVLGPISMMVQKDHDLAEFYGLRATVRQVNSELHSGVIKTITSVAAAQDGKNASLVVLEELHAQKHGLYQVMSSSQGSRRAPLMAMITTAGRITSGLCWDIWKKVERLLLGLYKNDSEFGIIYTVDKADLKDPYSDYAMMKANPMWGVSVLVENARAEATNAINDANLRSEYLRTRLNVWSNAEEKIFDPAEWEACGPGEGGEKPIIEQYYGCKAYIGVDLALKSDMVAAAILIEEGDKIIAFPKYYIPADAKALSDPDMAPMYDQWIEAGLLEKAGEGIISLSPLRAQLEEWHTNFEVEGDAIDPSFASHFASKLVEDGFPVLMFKNTAENMSEPTDDLVAMIKAKKFVHDGNPILDWNSRNTVGHRNTRGLILPKKDSANSPRKIDGMHAVIFANALRVKNMKSGEEKAQKVSPYVNKPLFGFSDDGVVQKF